MKIDRLILIGGIVISFIIFALIFVVINDYEQYMLEQIPEYSCYKLEIELHNKHTQTIFKEIQKEFLKRDCVPVRDTTNSLLGDEKNG